MRRPQLQKRRPFIEHLESRHLLAAHLLGDINPAPETIDAAHLNVVGDTVFFSGQKGLWKADSITEESGLLAEVDIKPWSQFQAVGDKLVFAGGDYEHGIELWASDGSADGTQRLLDIAPGTDDGLRSRNSEMFINVGDEVFFPAYVGNESSLWKSNGTTAGTSLVKVFDTAFTRSQMVEMQGELYFVVGESLMKSNGTDLGTVRVASANNLLIQAASSEFVFFTTGSRRDEMALFRTDGTEAGTIQLHDNISGAEGVVMGDQFFYAPTGTSELWKSDGTKEGTQPVQDLGEHPLVVLEAANERIFIGRNRPFVFGGPPAFSVAPLATELVTFNPATNEEQILAKRWRIYSRNAVTSVGDRAYFNFGGLWQSDGTLEGTVQLPDGVDPRIVANGKQFFVDSDGLYASDGTPNSARLVPVDTGLTLDSMPAPNALPVPEFQELEDAVYFTANQGLWRTDGSELGTTLVREWDAPTMFAADQFQGNALVLTAERLSAFSFPGGKSELWASNGTADGTIRIASLESPLFPILQLEDYIYFHNGNGQLWQLDAQLELKELAWHEDAGSRLRVQRLRDQTVFATTSHTCTDTGCEHFVELRVAEGDAEDAKLIATIGPSSREGLFERMVPIGDALAFIAEAGDLGSEIWLTDGTEDGTKLAFETIEGTDAGGHKSLNPFNLRSHNDGILYEARKPSEPSTIYWSDGTKAGTRPIASGWEILTPGDFFPVGEGFAFTAKQEASGRELWLWSESGGTQIVDIAAGSDSSYPSFLGALPNGKLYFSANDNVHGIELWVTDGTVAGTQMVKDINIRGGSGPTASGVTRSFSFLAGNPILPSLEQSEDGFFFVAGTFGAGREVWHSDGTEQGTVQVVDIHGTDSSNPHSLQFIDGKLFFAAEDEFGFEPRAYAPGIQPLPGDADGDGRVGFSDFLILSANFGKEEQVFANGDFDGDTNVTFADFLILSENFGTERN